MKMVNAVTRLYKIFRTNNWIIKDVDEFVFNNFCFLIENLSENQRTLILELAERYMWISFTDYQSGIINTLEMVEEEKLNKLKKIYFFPIIKPEDEGDIKSGISMCYQIKGLKNLLKDYKNIKFEFFSKFDDLSIDRFEIGENEALFLVDDYIGSGETLNICLEQILLNPNISADKVSVISIACQNEIYEQIRGKGYSFYSKNVCKKGISDFNEGVIKDEKINVMLEIEKLIPGGNHFSFGYNESEALITLGRTPDNTFPIFWKTYKKGGEKFEAPFSREEYSK